jgi:hypothetical protein
VALVTALAVVPGTALGAKPVEQVPRSLHSEFLDRALRDSRRGRDRRHRQLLPLRGRELQGHGLRQGHVHEPRERERSRHLIAGQLSGPPPIIDEEAGTITFVTSFKGLPEKIQTAHGPVLLRDAGFVQFADTFDMETGDFISSEVVVKGPHPELDSDFALFCEVITEALA